MCFPILFPLFVNSLFPCFGNCMDFCLTQNIWETHNFRMFVFSHTFPKLWEFTFPMFWELLGFLLQLKNIRNPLVCNVSIFPYFSFTMGIYISHIFGIIWINSSHEIWKSPIALEFLCFFICFPYYENSVFPCFWICMSFYYTRNRGVRNM